MCSQGVPDLELLERGWIVKQVKPELGYIGPEPVFLYRQWPVMNWIGQYFARRHEGLPNNEEEAYMEGLTPGRIVHYVLGHDEMNRPEAHRPAIVTEVYHPDREGDQVDSHVDLTVFCTYGDLPMGAQLLKCRVEHNPNGAPGTWHWIERA